MTIISDQHYKKINTKEIRERRMEGWERGIARGKKIVLDLKYMSQKKDRRSVSHENRQKRIRWKLDERVFWSYFFN
jgi:DNA invertase Pin-like site-specific DNA recombinase